ncbi:apolipoprotein N-acyltransferase [Thiocapsa bogorovii]|uniref:apolipoprotein N-acyltransferase n=1 Tax=Thiocapsa bogorovii TaxID=521689 RepID=UPI001E372F76|nr:apolipoprotein N-acyltransferase [Thiocapsa bogorovii]UHD14708.1 apolipoprotein N-acyltransferase [Thiocapsa bogorovii]
MPIGAAVSSALLYRLAFVLDTPCCLLWVAFVPLILVAANYTPTPAFLFGWLSSFILNFGTAGWVLEIPGFSLSHGLLLGVYAGIFPALWCAIIALARRRRLTLLLLAPAAWVVLDYLRAHAGPLALSWGTPAYWQHANLPILQLASYAGEYGVTYLVLFVNSAIALGLMERKWRFLAVAGIPLAVVFSAGAMVLRHDSLPTASVRVALVQPAFSVADLKSFSGPEKLDVLERLSVEAGRSRPDLIVWPEAVVHDWRRSPGLLLRIGRIAQEVNAPIVLGMSESGKSFNARGSVGALPHGPEARSRNSAVLVSAKGDFSGVYNKNRLVPFSEFIPFEGFVNWPDWIPPPGQPMAPGTHQVEFEIAEGVTAAPIICWENLFADYVRGAVRQDTDMVLQLVNDNWAGRTLAPYQHEAASVVRAVENRVPVVIASNTGPSRIIDAYGRILAELPDLFTPGVAVANVRSSGTRSFYYRNGDWMVLLCGLIVTVVIMLDFVFGRR